MSRRSGRSLAKRQRVIPSPRQAQRQALPLQPTPSERTIDLAHQFDQYALAAAPAVHNRAPYGIVHGPVRISKGPVKSKAEEIRRVKEREGYDPSLRQHFTSHYQAEAYRKENGIARMTVQEFESECAGSGTSFVARRFKPIHQFAVENNLPVDKIDKAREAFQRGAAAMSRQGRQAGS